MKKIFSGPALIVHLFALLHAAVSFACWATGIADELMLTVLTMMLVMLLCLREEVSVLFMALAAIAVNVIGFLLGKGIASLLYLLVPSPEIVHPVSTFVSTEIIGWASILVIKLYKRKRGRESPVSTANLVWLLVAFIFIIISRFILVMRVNSNYSSTFIIELILDYSFCFLAILGVALYAVRTQMKAQEEKEKASLAQFQYLKLKQQLNPHFLFNSLNVLDCMIQEQSPDKASEYTHRLAEIYRYMLSNEENVTVPLRDEMVFVGDYVALLQVRFPDGLQVRMDVPENDLSRLIVPCGIQLLIENATKHNAVRTTDPLVIEIRSDGESVTVKNNLCPKVTPTKSTGLGLKYIRQQYKDVANKSIAVVNDGTNYSVTLPLL